MDSLRGMGRKPRFDVHIKIYDLNNVPLVSGQSYIKWHLPHSMHADHRGRTTKCGIVNHRVDYSFGKHIPKVGISVDRANNLTEYPIEFEVLQEFALAEKITLGVVRLNLSEYVEESQAFTRGDGGPTSPVSLDNGSGASHHHVRKRSNSIGVSPTSTPKLAGDKHEVLDGITRRYLMQDSKVNSTLKISILMVQTDGDRNYVAPTLRTAPVFGGIAGMMAGDQPEDDTGPIPNISKPRDATEMQDIYRRTLAASWFRLPAELPADEAVEDIFAGGNGWRTAHLINMAHTPTSTSDDEDNHHNHHHGGGLGLGPGPSASSGTLRPSDFPRYGSSGSPRQPSSSGHYSHHPGHRRTPSATSDRSATTVTARQAARAKRHDEEGPGGGGGPIRSGSLISMTPTLGSASSSGVGMQVGKRPVREVDEAEVRDDLVAWKLPCSE